MTGFKAYKHGGYFRCLLKVLQVEGCLGVLADPNDPELAFQRLGWA